MCSAAMLTEGGVKKDRKKGKQAGKTQLFGQSAYSGEQEEGERGKEEMMDRKLIFFKLFLWQKFKPLPAFGRQPEE